MSGDRTCRYFPAADIGACHGCKARAQKCSLVYDYVGSGSVSLCCCYPTDGLCATALFSPKGPSSLQLRLLNQLVRDLIAMENETKVKFAGS